MQDQKTEGLKAAEAIKQKGTDVQQLLADLHGGVFERKLAHVLTQAGLAVVDSDGQGAARVVVTFDLKKISQGRQLKLDHSINYIIPTANGQKAEKDRTNTIVFVNEGGNITIVPETQGQLFGGNK